MSLALVRSCLRFFLFVPTLLSYIFHATLLLLFLCLLSLDSLLLFILCAIHTSCMGSPFPIVHAKCSFATTKDCSKPRI